jgi:uncharacterized protein YoxC
VVAASLGGIAAIIAAVAWAVLVCFLGLLLFNVTKILDSTKELVDGIRSETVPLLGDVRVTVQEANKNLVHVDGIATSVEHIVKSAERVSIVVEQAVSSPLVKVAAYGAGFSRAAKKVRRGR